MLVRPVTKPITPIGWVDVAVVVVRGRKTPRRLPDLLPAMLSAIAQAPRGAITTVSV
jgi:hypothetical protein